MFVSSGHKESGFSTVQKAFDVMSTGKRRSYDSGSVSMESEESSEESEEFFHPEGKFFQRHFIDSTVSLYSSLHLQLCAD